jgi:RNA polymerase sigma-70 factor (ECF subfamily)
MPSVSTERAHWLAAHILPLEAQLRAWLRRVTPRGIEVDDLIQEAYAKLASLPENTCIAFPKAYLYQITKRLINDHIRHSTVISIEALAEAAQLSALRADFTPERILSGRQELERLYQAIASLPDPCRAVFVMRKFDDMPQKAIAAELRISENAVEKRMARALRIIIEYLQVNDRGVAKDGQLARAKRQDPQGA